MREPTIIHTFLDATRPSYPMMLNPGQPVRVLDTVVTLTHPQDGDEADRIEFVHYVLPTEASGPSGEPWCPQCHGAVKGVPGQPGTYVHVPPAGHDASGPRFVSTCAWTGTYEFEPRLEMG